jgi:hypothetical protein
VKEKGDRAVDKAKELTQKAGDKAKEALRAAGEKVEAVGSKIKGATS